MTLELFTTITLNEAETFAFEKLLGNLTGKQKTDVGLTQDEQSLLSEIYSQIPKKDGC